MTTLSPFIIGSLINGSVLLGTIGAIIWVVKAGK